MLNLYLSGSFLSLGVLCLYSEDWDFKFKPYVILMIAIAITSWLFVMGAIINKGHRSAVKMVYENLKDKYD